MPIAMHISRTQAHSPIRGFRADCDPNAAVGSDGLTDGERRQLAENYIAEAATFTRQDFAKAHALKMQMQKRDS